MVPGTPRSLRICSISGDIEATIIDPERFTALVTALNRLPVQASQGFCDGAVSEAHYLAFGYDSGPALFVAVRAGCDRPVDNGGLASKDTGAVLPLLKQLIRTG